MTRAQIRTEPPGHTYQNISHDGGQLKKSLSNRLNQREIEKIGQHCITKTFFNSSSDLLEATS
jgi:hypothetical protein